MLEESGEHFEENCPGRTSKESMSIFGDNMELARTISHLAAANEQLATAHNVILGHLQRLLIHQFQNSYSKKNESTGIRYKTACISSKGRSADSQRPRKTHLVKKKKNLVTKTQSRRQLRPLRRVPAFDETDESNFINSHSKAQSIEDSLRKQIEEVTTESRAKNDRLLIDLEEQRLVIKQLTQSFEDSKRECERKDRRMDLLTEKLSKLQLEKARLLAELETFQGASTEAEKCSSVLETKLAEQDEEKRKHLLALDEATQQIRSLEFSIQAHDQSNSTNLENAEEKDALSESQAGSSTSTSLANEEFKRELLLKREARQRAIAAISVEMDRLRSELKAEKIAHSETTKLLEDLKAAQAKSDAAAAQSKTDSEADSPKKTDNEKLSERMEALRLFELLKISDEVTSDLWLQLERTDDLRFQLENEPEENRVRICSLRRLAEETRSALLSRKQQVGVLKDRLAQIVVRLGERSFLDDYCDEIRLEADRQLEDIARSRGLSDERSRILSELKEHSAKELHDLKIKLDNSRRDCQILEEDLRKTEDKMDAQDAEILNLESQLGLAKADCRDLQNQMSVINSLFTQMLLSASSAEMDLDRLTRLLQENHDLISGVAKENSTEAAALPKLLLDIIEQVDGRVRESQEKSQEDDLQEESIAHNLPKVWRILLELLSCQAAGSAESNPPDAASSESAPDSCYKSVDTPTGPRLVISVSKTYIRLKELILEKKHLEKEMNRMKQLNNHLETKLSTQEKRLSTVSDELSKTWNVVGRMQAQHQQLHTHEKILRYELQQKRKMLQELKQELEYCREKWESARQKNTNSEMEWRNLRREFAARKALASHSDSFNNSGESGFSDEREEESDEDDDDNEVGKRVRPMNSRRRSRKDGSRPKTPDTESELPTDNEISEPRTQSSISSQRTPTPETEAEFENIEMPEENSDSVTPRTTVVKSSSQEIIDPLDKALTNVIQNLLLSGSANDPTPSNSVAENLREDTNSQDAKLANLPESKVECSSTVQEPTSALPSETCQDESDVGMVCQIKSQPSVFTIGPFQLQLSESTKNVQFSNPLEIGPSTSTSIISNQYSNNESNLPEIINSHSTDASLPEHISMPETDSTIVEHITLSKTSEPSTESDNMSIGSESSLETVKDLTSNEQIDMISSSASSSEVDAPQSSTSSSSFPASNAMLDARAARLKSLEEQAEWLVRRVNATNKRGSALNSRLQELHETYGSTPTAPPMPDILPSFRLNTASNERSVDRDGESSSERVDDVHNSDQEHNS
ncbi:hypothetical protein QAD02_010996 [Eretmocerus hayati]|uniref:Uncharacterized protein n=1 Tax=Eretmocerus hayati TaxID=131215 RepID=A0ACC2P093_9HYME|nr:hypothetical protein QAD02_010996 [Eretmocerus hayati]